MQEKVNCPHCLVGRLLVETDRDGGVTSVLHSRPACEEWAQFLESVRRARATLAASIPSEKTIAEMLRERPELSATVDAFRRATEVAGELAETWRLADEDEDGRPVH